MDKVSLDLKKLDTLIVSLRLLIELAVKKIEQACFEKRLIKNKLVPNSIESSLSLFHITDFYFI